MTATSTTYQQARKSPASIMPDLTGYVTTDEAAQELEFHVNHIRRMIRRGDLEYKRVGHMLFVSLESIEKYKKSTKGFDKHSPLKRENFNKK